MSQSKSLPGANLIIYINNAPVGFVTGFQWQTSSNKRVIYGLDSLNAFEIAPARNSISGTISCLRLKMDGGLEGRGVVAPQSSTLLEKYISISIIDRSTDTVVFSADTATVTEQQWQVQAGDLLKGSFNFEAISFNPTLGNF